MSGKEKTLLGYSEKAALIILGALVLIHLLLWRVLKPHPLYSVILLAVAVLVFLSLWAWKNFMLVRSKTAASRKTEEKLNSLLQFVFSSRGYHIERSLVDEDGLGWAWVRDLENTPVIAQYCDLDPRQTMSTDSLRKLFQRMNLESSPKGVCLTTGAFDQESLIFARKNNILTMDGNKLLSLINMSREDTIQKEHDCPHCGTLLQPSGEITGLMLCPNPDCRKVFEIEKLEEYESRGKKGPVNTVSINCFECGREVEIKTGMSGLMECPWPECSWIINIDNELLALRGGLEKKVSERLVKIACPKCGTTLTVTADAEGLMECPNQSCTWVIDLGEILGEGASAQAAEKLPEEEEEKPAPLPEPPPAQNVVTPAQTEQAPDKESHTLSTKALVIFFLFSLVAFAAFVYSVLR